MMTSLADLAFVVFGIALPLVRSWNSRVAGRLTAHWRGYWVVLWVLMVGGFAFGFEDYRGYAFIRLTAAVAFSQPTLQLSSSITESWEGAKNAVWKWFERDEAEDQAAFPVELQEIMSTTDIASLKKYLNNPTPIPIRNIKIHPIADTPRTLGCITIVQLGIMAADHKLSDKDQKKLEPFFLAIAKYLGEGSQDEKENSIYTVYYLLELNSDLSSAMLEAGVFDSLLGCFDTPKFEVKLTLSSCCFAIYSNHLPCKARFVQSRAYETQLSMLGSGDELADCEISQHLTALILVRTDGGMGVNQAVKQLLLNAGVVPKLQDALSKSKEGSYTSKMLNTCLREFAS
jgi:hypothetical protein